MYYLPAYLIPQSDRGDKAWHDSENAEHGGRCFVPHRFNTTRRLKTVIVSVGS